MQVIILTEHADLGKVEDVATLAAIIDRFGVTAQLDGHDGVTGFFERELKSRGVKVTHRDKGKK